MLTPSSSRFGRLFSALVLAAGCTLASCTLASCTLASAQTGPSEAIDADDAGALEPSRAAQAAATQSQPAATKPASASSVYVVGSDDVLRIEVFDELRLTGEYTVDPTGHVTFPLIGRVDVNGLTLGRVTTRIHTLLEADYLYNPQVSITVKEFRSRKVEVLGAVGRPGTYFLDRTVRLLDLLSRAEGLAPGLGEVRRGQMVRITRAPSVEHAQGERLYVDLYELLVLGKEMANLTVEAGDVIYVPESKAIYVIGEVKLPGRFPYEEGMTVLKAITLAGGTSTKASLKGAIVRRIEDGREIKVKSKLEDRLRADDIVEVESSFW